MQPSPDTTEQGAALIIRLLFGDEAHQDYLDFLSEEGQAEKEAFERLARGYREDP